MAGITVDLRELLSDTNRVRISLDLLCNKYIHQHIDKTLTLDELALFINALTDIWDYAHGEQRVALVTVPDPYPAVAMGEMGTAGAMSVNPDRVVQA